MIMKKMFMYGISLFVLLLMFAQVDAQSPKKAMKAGKASLKGYQYDAAIQSFTEAIGISPTLVDAYILRGQAYEKSNKLQEAADDYSKAAEMSPKNQKLPYDAGRLLFILGKHVEAIHMLNHSLELNKGYLPAYLIKVNCLVALKNFSEALATCDQALAIKKTAQNYYNHGMVSENLKNDKVAESDYRNSIKIDKKFKQSYVGLANVLTRQNKTDEALKYCTQAIAMYPSYSDAYFTRSGIYFLKSDLMNALSDITKTIDLDPQNDNLYFLRAGYNKGLTKSKEAISDYSKAISLNNKNYMAYYNRALVYEESKKASEAASDYINFLKIAEINTEIADLVTKAKQKVYDLNTETVKPEIVLNNPVVNADGSVDVALDAKKVNLDGTILDQSKLEYVKINDKEYTYDKNLNKVPLAQEIPIEGDNKITIVVSDIYHNLTTMTYKINRTEIDPPVIDVLTPYTNEYKDIFLQSETPTVFIEGKIADESLIKLVTIDGIDTKFFSDKTNPNFSATIDITGKEKITIKAVDVYGNTTENSYKLDRTSARIAALNPMGKTWVIFIDNSDYESFASLEGPAKDITTMRAAFSKYDIHNIIEKKNMTKAQMEKFFSIELRDLVKNQNVKSLLVWYAGHGKFINETGYWIPVDAKRDEEFTYFNVNSLKAFMQTYTNYVTHVLVVTDACESGPSFYAAMRGAKKRECGDYEPTKFKSSQVFSSAGSELAADNSPFTKTFAKSLDYNTNSCIAIDNIVISVTESIGQAGKQSPKFGKIAGLDDEDGTFFFIKKSQ
jgi:tetratricopeptide (TPR) repeat protein